MIGFSPRGITLHLSPRCSFCNRVPDFRFGVALTHDIDDTHAPLYTRGLREGREQSEESLKLSHSIVA